MPRCPQCQKPLQQLVRRCPSCQADLELLVDYVNHLQEGLERAENLTRAGELDQAVWAYLEVLETDPDNPVARKQVSRVATAVRQFDRTSPSRAWWRQLRGGEGVINIPLLWIRNGAILILVFILGIVLGFGIATPTTEKDGGPPQPEPPPIQKPARTLTGN